MMTRKEFKANPPIYERCLFSGKVYEIIAVNNQELCGLDFGTDEPFWVRCEDITLVKK